MTDDRTSQKIQLRDGRLLGYADYGPSQGLPIFYFHGFPSSRLDWRLFCEDNTLMELGIRIIAPDRPGYGLSDFQPSRDIVDWPSDVVALANALGIDRFAALGVSGGGPYAIACAHGIGDQLTKAGIVCGMGPADAPGMKDGVSWTLPGMPSFIRRALLTFMSIGLRRNPKKFLAKSKESASAPDREVLDQPHLAVVLKDSIREAFRRGVGGANYEAGLYSRPWEFSLNEIRADVYLWHGGEDLNIPISVARYIVDAIPDCQASFEIDEGHFSLPYNHMRKILGTLVDDSR